MRTASIQRKTNETKISVDLNIDGSGQSNINTGVGFFDHMLDQVCRHGMFDLSVHCEGDHEIDDHHSVEDVGIALGLALDKAIGEKIGIYRYGHAYIPLDEALSRVVIDFSGRPLSVFSANFSVAKIGAFDVQLIEEFFQALASNARATIHATSIHGSNAHHIAETLFKALGKAMRFALTHDPQNKDQVPSTKGRL